MPIVFFGSSEFSLASLRACIDSGIKIACAVTTPDAPKGRGLKNLPTPVKTFCEEQKIPVISPAKLKEQEPSEYVRELAPDYFVVASYGKMIPDSWLTIPKKLRINVHPSLLPKYRGAAPIQWPLLNGDLETALTLAEVTGKLDAGDIFYQDKFPIPENMNAEELTKKLEDMSYSAVKALLDSLNKGGKEQRTPQNEAATSYARKLTREDGRLDWNETAVTLHNKIRALVTWPKAFAAIKGECVQILKSSLLHGSEERNPGEIIAVEKDGLAVKTGKGALKIEKIKPAGKKEMSAAEFARGRRLAPGDTFTKAE